MKTNPKLRTIAVYPRTFARLNAISRKTGMSKAQIIALWQAKQEAK